jgi:hypothetical protein
MKTRKPHPKEKRNQTNKTKLVSSLNNSVIHLQVQGPSNPSCKFTHSFIVCVGVPMLPVLLQHTIMVDNCSNPTCIFLSGDWYKGRQTRCLPLLHQLIQHQSSLQKKHLHTRSLPSLAATAYTLHWPAMRPKALIKFQGPLLIIQKCKVL